ncbi:ABC transporter permease [Maritalea porphyrae]|jgi:peptide/nickel transport system permease protein|uniref:ABC transporter permease n=2 Tax=Maritalea TaxID=623276 RepID=UPI0022AF4C0A|nr:ABC transporter permease [Maritalea porphyrae]MCZ4273491.1 ABC transporter permease [Maritalea porphyrae]
MSFILRRILFYIVAFLVAASINFMLPRLMPGNPIDIMFANAGNTLPPEAKKALAETFGFVERPLYEEYFIYLKSVFSWDFGISIKYYPLTVLDVLMMALPWTLFLAGTSVILAFCIGSMLGVYAAWKRGSWFDSLVSPSALAVQSVPALVVAITTLYVFGLVLQWLPTGYAYAPALDPGWTWSYFGSIAYHAIMPVGTLAFVSLGGYLITMRNNMIGQLGEEHVVMGHAKGLTDSRVRYNYAARNALLPSMTAFALSLGSVMGGSLIIEIVFNYPGLGNLLFQGIIARDYPLIQGQLIIMTLAMLTANLLIDFIYIFLDPRLRKA